MSDRPTQETDALVLLKNGYGPTAYEWREHSRRLERERNKAREDATNYYAKIGELEQERDEAREEWGKASMDAAQLFSEKTKVIAERDELRENLARIESLLLDPHAVFLNFLHGKIAKLDWAKLEHIHGPHPARVERDEAREALEYIAHAGLSARHIEDYAKDFLRRKEAAK